MTEKYKAPIIKKAFQILNFISDHDREVSISELSKELAISKSTVHRITSALEDLGAISKNPLTKKYSLGPTLIELDRSAYSKISIKEIARPVLEDLMGDVKESVFLGTINGDHVTITDIVEGIRELKITSPVGTRIPLLAGATGKIFLSAMSETQVKNIIKEKGLNSFTEKTVTDTKKYLDMIQETRINGYAIDDEEYIMGVKAVAAPIIIPERNHVSAVWVVGFKPNMCKEKMMKLVNVTKIAADKIVKKVRKL